MLKLASLGWGAKRIAEELGCSRNTVRRYLRQGGWQPYRAPSRPGRLHGARRTGWRSASASTAATPMSCARNCSASTASRSSLRTVERAVAHLRRELAAQTRGHGALRDSAGAADADRLRHPARVALGGEPTQGPPVRRHAGLLAPHLRRACSCTSASRPGCRASRARSVTSAARRASCWSTTPGRWSSEHDAQTREVDFNDRFHAFCRYWGVVPRACAPYRARTKGKDERGVGYVKRNAIAGHRFATLETLQRAPGALDARGGRRARARHHRRGTAGALRARRALRGCGPWTARAPFLQVRELVPPGAQRRLRRSRHQPLQRAVAAHRRERHRRRGRAPACACCTPAVEVACHAQSAGPTRQRDRAQPSRRHRRGVLGYGRAVWRRTPCAADDGCGRRTAAAAGRLRVGARRCAGDGRGQPQPAMHGDLEAMLTRLKLTAMRDQLDGLLDEAARAELNLREALALLCAAEVARKDERRIQMGISHRQVPVRANARGLRLRRAALGGRAGRSGSSPPRAGWPTATACCCSARPGWASRTWPWRSGARRSCAATRRCSSGHGAGDARSRGRTPKAGWRSGCVHYAKPKLLIVDELGYLPFEPHAAHLFFQLVSRRYERGSMLVTSNRSVAEWGRRLRRRRGGHRHPRPAAAPQPRHHHPRRQLPAAREAPRWPGAPGRRATRRLSGNPGVSSWCRRGVSSGCRLTAPGRQVGCHAVARLVEELLAGPVAYELLARQNRGHREHPGGGDLVGVTLRGHFQREDTEILRSLFASGLLALLRDGEGPLRNKPATSSLMSQTCGHANPSRLGR